MLDESVIKRVLYITSSWQGCEMLMSVGFMQHDANKTKITWIGREKPRHGIYGACENNHNILTPQPGTVALIDRMSLAKSAGKLM